MAAAELRTPGDASLLLPAEAACLGRAVQKRVQEFAAGRLCARRALAQFGIEGFALRVRGDRRPDWPAGMVGSITHTQGLCAAVAAEARHFAGLGIDSEIVGDVRADIWPRICVPREIDWLRSLGAAEQERAATLIFAVKEAFYKCQYPIVEEFLSFHDLWIELPEWGRASARAGMQGEQGTCTVHATRAVAIAEHGVFPALGRYRQHERFVSAGVAFPAAEASSAADWRDPAAP